MTTSEQNDNANINANAQYAPNIPKYFVYTVLKGIGFAPFGAIWVIYLQQQRGLSLTEATIIDVSFFIAAALFEIPTGIVADTFGRKTSLAIGAALMGVSALAWPFAPTVPLIILAHVGIAIGNTFLSGAEDALLFETLQITGHANEYQRLAGRVQATMLGALAFGSVTGGLLASINLLLPFLIGGFSILMMLGIVLTFKEPQLERKSSGQARKSYRQILHQSLTIMRVRPTLLYPMLYFALVPLADIIMETFFLQPQAVSLGIPIAAIGVIVMALQLTNMAGSSLSHRIKASFGERRVLYTAPVMISASLILLALLQTAPALLVINIIGFVTAILHPLLLSRIQNEVPDDIRATILSVQSLMFTLLLAVGEPILGFMADRAGLPSTYVALAGGLSILVLLLLVKSRRHFPAEDEGNEPAILGLEANA